MANGMSMMLKSIGIDPEEIMSNVENFKKVVVTAIGEVRDAQKRVEATQAVILDKQEQILLRLAHPSLFDGDTHKFDHLHDDNTGLLTPGTIDPETGKFIS